MPRLTPPEGVARFHEAYSAPTRVTVLRILLEHPRSYADMFDAVGDAMSRGAVYKALTDLGRLGYVTDDAAPGLVRKPVRTVFAANRELIARDLADTVADLLG